MSENRIFRSETRPRREVSTSRETEDETRREIKQFLKSNWRANIFTPQGGRGERVRERKREKERERKKRSLKWKLKSYQSYESTSNWRCWWLGHWTIRKRRETDRLLIVKNLSLVHFSREFSLSRFSREVLFLTRSSVSHEKRERDEISLMVS